MKQVEARVYDLAAYKSYRENVILQEF